MSEQGLVVRAEQPTPLREGGFWYLASPYAGYAGYAGNRWTAFKLVCQNAALLLRAGIPVFAPIAHSHPIATSEIQLPGGDHDLWLPLDEKFMAVSRGLIVLKLAGWDKSKGVTWEIDWFTARGLPVVYMEPGWVPKELS